MLSGILTHLQPCWDEIWGDQGSTELTKEECESFAADIATALPMSAPVLLLRAVKTFTKMLRNACKVYQRTRCIRPYNVGDHQIQRFQDDVCHNKLQVKGGVSDWESANNRFPNEAVDADHEIEMSGHCGYLVKDDVKNLSRKWCL